MASHEFKTRLQMGMAIAVTLWGAGLGVGAWIYNDDIRKFVIILGCTAAFMVLWGAAYIAGLRKVAGKTDTVEGGLNFSSAFGFLLGLAATSTMAAVAFAGWKAPRWAFALMFAAAAASGVASIVGLSNPRQKLGRWLGLVGLGLLAGGFVIGFYVNR